MNVFCKKDKKTGEEIFGFITRLPDDPMQPFMHLKDGYTEAQIRKILSEFGRPELDIEGIIAEAKNNAR